jgi:hypothetical protein
MSRYGPSLEATFAAACLAFAATGHAMDDAARLAVRERVRLGQINVCVVETLQREGDRPVLQLRNDCDTRVSVTLCLRSGGQVQPDFFTLLIPARSEARQQLLLHADTPFSYRFNSCRGASCTAPRPEC